MRIEPQINPLNAGEELNAVAEAIAPNEPEFDSNYPTANQYLKPGSSFAFNGQSVGAAVSGAGSGASLDHSGPFRPPIKVKNITNSRQVFDTLYSKSKVRKIYRTWDSPKTPLCLVVCK